MFSKQRRKSVFILKPENNCQGKGIRLVRNYKSVPPEEHVLCQQYISKVRSEIDFWNSTICMVPLSEMSFGSSSPPKTFGKKELKK